MSADETPEFVISADCGNAADYGQESHEASLARLRSNWRAGGRLGCLWRR